MTKDRTRKSVRIALSGGKGNTDMLTLYDTDLESVINFTKEVFSKTEVNVQMLVTSPPPPIRVTCFESTGVERGPSKSYSIYGITVKEAKEALTKNIENEN